METGWLAVRMARTRMLEAVAAAVCVFGCQPRDAPAQVVEPTRFEITGLLPSPELRESSGVAVSRTLNGVLWTHNDSGDEPLLYAIDASGNVLARIRLSGVRPVDWEDVALGPCPNSPRDCLYIADTGDNSERRETAALYIVEEPQELAPALDTIDVPLVRGVTLRYTDGPHDIEAIAVVPTGVVLLISKGRRGTIGVYRISPSELLQDSLTVERSQTLDLVPQRGRGRQVTGAAVSPDGGRLVIRTYIELVFYQLVQDAQISNGTPCTIAGRELQGEAVDFLDDSTLVLTSEALLGRRGTIARVQCPIR